MKKGSRFRTYIKSYDKGILLCYLALCVIGLIVMLNISSVQSSLQYFYKQLFFFVASFIVALVVLYLFNFEKIRRANIYLVYLTIALLVLVLIKGVTKKGATRAIDLKLISLQPSFIARVALVFLFAHILDYKNELLRATKNIFHFPKNFLELTVLSGVVFYLIYAEKHLSSIIIAGITLLGMLWYAGIRKRIMLILLIVGVAGAFFMSNHSEAYRKQRIETYKKYNLFFKDREVQETDQKDYQVKESLTALTSGGLFGTGIARGRGKHYYLPEARTDYVFTIIGEEFGYFGAMIVFLLHSLLFFFAIRVSNRNENQYLRFLGVGLALNIYINVLVNTGVAMSIIPSTGNTLPFISYGGSALMMDSVAVGALLNISAQRREL
ncbi:MAG: FtsW/RodA/SpoVE family cell cycle protein [Candidatus Cloacimonetes bacterium]|nr:FtsW/RodA/SpoVE family cell cycle protein [Candidatus Cloacimonadota bacterium]